MAKKKAKTTTKSSKSHGELFDKHNNLKWLLPIFFIISAVAVIMMYNSNQMINNSEDLMSVEEIPTIDSATNSATESTDNTLGY